MNIKDKLISYDFYSFVNVGREKKVCQPIPIMNTYTNPKVRNYLQSKKKKMPSYKGSGINNQFLIDDWADNDSNMSDESVNMVMKNLKEIMGNDEFE